MLLSGSDKETSVSSSHRTLFSTMCNMNMKNTKHDSIATCKKVLTPPSFENISKFATGRILCPVPSQDKYFLIIISVIGTEEEMATQKIYRTEKILVRFMGTDLT